MSGFFGTLGLAALSTAADNINNWLQGGRNVSNSKKLMDYQSQKQVETQSKLNALLYPQQIASMRMAGLNPAMISGPMQAANASAPGATQNMEAPRSDVIGAASAASTLSLNESQRELNVAQAENLRADAEVKREEAGLKEQENFYFPETWRIKMDNLIQQSLGFSADASVARARVDEIHASVDRISKDIEQINQYIDLLKNQGEQVKENTKWIAPQARASISNLSAQARLYSGTDNRESQKIFYQVENLAEDLYLKRSQADLNKSQIEINKVVRDAQEFSLSLEKKFGTANQWLNLFGKGLQYVGGAAGAAAGAFYGTNKLGSFLSGSKSVPDIKLDPKGWLP